MNDPSCHLTLSPTQREVAAPITALARPGRMLLVQGNVGCGRTTLLQALHQALGGPSSQQPISWNRSWKTTLLSSMNFG